ncbi:MAG: protein kinase [Dehalococcoidia bacterium]|jgi:hypothetical protein|nr:protein kinase [Dehalococcoidia bacterium]
MPSERVTRRIADLLDQAESALSRQDWAAVIACTSAVLHADPANEDAIMLAGMAEAAVANSSARTLDYEVEPATRQDSGPTNDSAPPESPGSVANDRYQVSKFLGEGGKKRVYLAHDTLLDREVAFALIKTEGFDQTSKERISREAQAMGRLGVHPNIVAVLDLGQEDDGSPYMVTELMGGGDVEALLEVVPHGGQARGPAPTNGPMRDDVAGAVSRGRPAGGLPLDRTIEIGKAVCEGLEFAHSRGIVHRDLKPGNVWLTEDGVAKIGDFGLAVMTDRSRLTREGMMVGTVSYMPPEQATGGEITSKADLYSLGAMLYEMVTGRPPFLGDDDIAIIGQHINTPPVAPTWHNGHCPRPLEALVMRLLSKDPAERPESAQDVFNALDAIDLTARGETVEQDQTSLESLAGGVFVGRQAEMNQLKAALEDVLGGRGRLVTLMGEPGIGKTRTAEELVTYAGLRGAQVLWGRCYETGGQPPYWPWVQAIRGYIREMDESELRRQMGSSASVVAEIVTDVKDRFPELQPPPQLDDPDSARFRLFDSITSFLKAASATRPFVIVLDDLHWSDRPSLTFLEFVAREIGQSRLLIVGTYRDMELNRRHPLTVTLGDLARERLYERVLLRGLSEQDVSRFIEIAAGAAPPAELSATVYRHTEGNPLFVTEVVRELVQSGELAQSRERGGSTWSVRIPEGVREVIGRRLDRLSERANEVLTTAAVVGRNFRLDALKELAEDTTEGQLLDVLDEALDARIIEELSEEVGHYQFTHALMQETLTVELSLTRRVRLHARIAETLERLYGDDAEARANGSIAELARHFAEAETLLGPDKAVHYLVAAGESAIAQNAPDAALPHFERAAEIATDNDRRLGQIWFGLGVAQAAVFGTSLAQTAWDNLVRAFHWFVDNGQTERAVEVAIYPVSIIGPSRGTADLFERALELAPERSRESGWLHVRLAVAMFSDRADHRSALRAGLESLADGRAANEPRIEARAYQPIGFAQFAEAEFTESFKSLSAGLAIARNQNDPQTRVRLAMLGVRGALAVGRLEKAREIAEESRSDSADLHDLIWIAQANLNLIYVAFLQGNFRECAKFAAEWAPGGSLARGDSPPPLVVAQFNFESGAADGLDGLYEAVRSPWEFLAVTTASAQRLAGLAHAVADQDFWASAWDIINDAALNPDPAVGGFWRSDISNLLVAYRFGEHEKLAIEYERIAPFSGYFDPFSFISFDRALGAAAAALGRNSVADRHFAEALAFADTAGYVRETAWTCSDYAEMLLDRDEPGDREKAIELQDEALAITQELGMRPLTERILARREVLRA